MDSWSSWEGKIFAFAKVEAATRRQIKDLLHELDVNSDEIVDDSGKKLHFCYIFILNYYDCFYRLQMWHMYYHTNEATVY